MPLTTFFKDAVTPTSSGPMRGNLGGDPSQPTSGKTGESYAGVQPAPLPINDLHQGTPDSGPGGNMYGSAVKMVK